MDPAKNAPPVRSLAELIGIASQEYTNIDTKMLTRILPYLIQLQDMVGLQKLKQTVFQQVLYYLQHLHIPPKVSDLTSEKEPISNKRKYDQQAFDEECALNVALYRANRHEAFRLRRRRWQPTKTELSFETVTTVNRQVDRNHLRVERGDYLNSIIYGPAGSGKTTVAKIIGLIYYSLGIFKTKTTEFKFILAHRDDLVGQYLGQTAIKTRAFLETYRGGCVVIDEAYSLGDIEKRDRFASEAIDTLTAFLSENRDDICVILSGYKEEMEARLFVMNPGLVRRFPWKHEIEKYKIDELREIFYQKAKQDEWKVKFTPFKFDKVITGLNLKNSGGDIENIFNTSKTVSSIRTVSLEISDRRVLIIEDIKEAIRQLDFKPEEEKHYLGMFL